MIFLSKSPHYSQPALFEAGQGVLAATVTVPAAAVLTRLFEGRFEAYSTVAHAFASREATIVKPSEPVLAALYHEHDSDNKVEKRAVVDSDGGGR